MKLNVKEGLFVKAKLEGLNQEEAGRAAGAKTSEGARKMAVRMSQRVQVQEALLIGQNMSLFEAGITRSKALKPIGDALEATRTIVHGKGSEESWVDEVPDHTTRLKAADMALKLLDKADDTGGSGKSSVTAEDMASLLNENDEVELQRIIFSRGNGDTK